MPDPARFAIRFAIHFIRHHLKEFIGEGNADPQPSLFPVAVTFIVPEKYAGQSLK